MRFPDLLFFEPATRFWLSDPAAEVIESTVVAFMERIQKKWKRGMFPDFTWRAPGIRGNIFAEMIVRPPRHLVWSTDTIDLSDPFQKCWLLRQTLVHGRAEDVHALDIEEIRLELDRLDLPKDVKSLWRRYLEHLDARSH